MEWSEIFIEIEDSLIPFYKFDIYERGMYIFLLNQTKIRGLECVILPLSKISEALSCSDWQARKTIRQLSEKGCIELEQTRKGHSVRVILPNELNIIKFQKSEKILNIDEIDFYQNRSYIVQIIERENNKCFYCLSEITSENCELDHVISQLKSGNNSYKNIVASCHKCNTRKQASDAEDFLRSLYRKGMLSDNEFEERQSALKAIQNGELKPEL